EAVQVEEPSRCRLAPHHPRRQQQAPEDGQGDQPPGSQAPGPGDVPPELRGHRAYTSRLSTRRTAPVSSTSSPVSPAAASRATPSSNGLSTPTSQAPPSSPEPVTRSAARPLPMPPRSRATPGGSVMARTDGASAIAAQPGVGTVVGTGVGGRGTTGAGAISRNV